MDYNNLSSENRKLSNIINELKNDNNKNNNLINENLNLINDNINLTNENKKLKEIKNDQNNDNHNVIFEIPEEIKQKNNIFINLYKDFNPKTYNFNDYKINIKIKDNKLFNYRFFLYIKKMLTIKDFIKDIFYDKTKTKDYEYVYYSFNIISNLKNQSDRLNKTIELFDLKSIYPDYNDLNIKDTILLDYLCT